MQVEVVDLETRLGQSEGALRQAGALLAGWATLLGQVWRACL